MKASDFVYKNAFAEAMKSGLPEREAGWIAADAVSRWKKKGKAADAISGALSEGKKQYRAKK